MIRNALLLIAVAALLLGCTDDVVFQATTPIPATGWDGADIIRYEMDITDTINKHDLFIDVRHTGDYPYSDLYLFVDLRGPDGRHLRDTVECLLADPTGRWYGKGTGFIFAQRTIDAKVLYKLGNRFPSKGRYTIQLEQAMRTEVLQGVMDIGISVERSQ